MLKLKNIIKTYSVGKNKLKVLKKVSMDVQEGDMVAIMGASGSGKSTLLNIIGILDTYDSGDYFLNGLQIKKKMSENKLANLRNQLIGFVFQSFNLINYKTAMENVALPLFYQGVSRRKRNKLAEFYLEKVGLKEWVKHLPSEMSGGQKQRVAIARALITKPKLILADEPTGALDSKTSEDIINFLRQINDEEKVTILIVTHEQSIAEQTDRIIHLKDGVVA